MGLDLALAPERPWAFAVAFGLGLVAIYPWLIYPAVLPLVAARARRLAFADPAEWPALTVLIAARNEEAHIGERVANILGQDYPRERLAIVCVSDASTDRTDALFAEAARPLGGRAVLLRQPAPSGKPAALVAGWREVRSDIVVLTDANSHFEPGALRALARPFADAQVGAVAGLKRIRVPEGAATHDAGEGFYWRMEARLRAGESRLGLCQSADGACWAVRRGLWDGSGPTAGRFADDLWGPLHVQEQGYRVVSNPDAVASEDAAPSTAAEVRRKRRTQYGTFLLLPHLGWMLRPRRWPALWCFLSHKALRLVTPWALIAHAAVLALAGGGWPFVAAAEPVAAAALMLVAASPLPTPGPLRVLGHAGYFLIALAGPALAGVDAVRALLRRHPGEAAHHVSREATRR